MGNSTFARTEIFWLEVFQLGEFFPNWGPLAPGAFLVCHLGSWSLSCLPRDTKARGLETLAYAVRLALPKSWESISTLISMPGSARRLGQRQACWGAVTLGRLPWADLSDRAALSPGCSHCCCAELLLSDSATDQLGLGNFGICVLEVFRYFWSGLSGNFQFVGIYRGVSFLPDLEQCHQFR